MAKPRTAGEKLAWMLAPVLGVGIAIALLALFGWLLLQLPTWVGVLIVVAALAAKGVIAVVMLFCASVRALSASKYSPFIAAAAKASLAACCWRQWTSCLGASKPSHGHFLFQGGSWRRRRLCAGKG